MTGARDSLRKRGRVRLYRYFIDKQNPLTTGRQIAIMSMEQSLSYLFHMRNFFESEVILMSTNIGKKLCALVAVAALLLIAAPMAGVTFRTVSAAPTYNVNSDGILTSVSGCEGDITLPSTVKVINPGVFANNTKITSVKLPNTVTEIKFNAFHGCSSLTSINIPTATLTMGNGVFSHCPNLTDIDTNHNAFFTYKNGVLYKSSVVVAVPSAAVATIRSGSTSIADYAFAGNTNLTTVTLPAGMQTVGNHAFSECSRLGAVNLPSSVTSIGYGTFEKTAIQSITLPSSVESIPTQAFSECASLKTVTLPTSGLREIGPMAFEKCTSLQSLKLPDSVSYIGRFAFQLCTSLKSINIPSAVTVLNNGILYNCGSLESIYFYDTVTSMSESVIEKCYGLKSVRMPSCFSSVPERYFQGFSKLETVSLSPNVTYIGDYAFSGCTSLKSFKTPSSCRTIGVSAFANCKSMTNLTLPEELVTLSRFAFSDCASLRTVTIPASVKVVATGSFAGCTSLTTVTMKGNQVIGGNAFEDCTSLKTFTYQSTKPTSINAYAFKNCAALTTFNMPKGMYINESAFYGCENLTGTIYLSENQTKIGAYTFYNCKKLSRVFFDSVNDIGEYAFAGCESLDEIYLYDIDDPVHYGEGAFMGSGLTWVTLSDQEKISDKAFMNCTKLAKVTVSGLCKTMGKSCFEGCTALKSICLTDEVQDRAFYGCTSLKDVYTSGLASLGESVFEGCTALETFPFPKTLTSMGTSVFEGCTALTKAILPSSLTAIPDRAFYGCTKLTSPNLTVKIKTVGNYAFYKCTAMENLILPAGVTTVGSSAFEYCSGLKMVNMTNNITQLGSFCFDSCTALNTVYFSTALTAIPASGFRDCPALTNVNLSKTAIKSVGSNAFYNCSAVTSVSLPDTVTSIGDGAFYNITKPASITIPKAVTSVGRYAFSCPMTVVSGNTKFAVKEGVLYSKDFTSLLIYPRSKTNTTVTVASGVTAIGPCAFYGVTPLKIVNLPDTVKTIDASAFSGCANLTTVKFSQNVKEIKAYAFSGCKALDTVNYTGTQAQWNSLMASGFYTTGNEAIMNVRRLVVNFGKTVSAMTVKTLPTKKVYTVGETFSPTGMTLNVTYTDGFKDVITKAYTYTPTGAMNSLGNQKIVVSYGGKSTGFYVTVNPKGKTVSSMAVKTLPTKRIYTIGETFDPTGMTLKITYSDSSTAIVSSGFSYTPVGQFTATGQQKMVVNYAGKTTGFYVTVTPAVSSVAIKTKPAKQTYTVGEYFESTGMILKVTYADGTTADVSSGYTYTPTGKFTAAGQQKITVTYGGKSTTLTVTVTKAVSTVAIKTKPTKQIYTVNETFNPAGMVLKVTYTDNTTAEVTSGYTYTPTGKLTTAGQQKIVVSYGGKSTGFYVTVNEAGKTVSSVVIKTKPTKQTYTVGESFNPAGMVLKITYTDNTTAEISSGYTYTPTGKLTAEGQQKIVVSYGGKSTGFYVTVNPAGKTISGVAIKTLPTKKTYQVGEIFDPTGMTLKITYSDMSTAIVSTGYSYTPTGKLTTAGQQKIVVTYGGKSTGFYVTVNS